MGRLEAIHTLPPSWGSGAGPRVPAPTCEVAMRAVEPIQENLPHTRVTGLTGANSSEPESA
jgi:hypothetical protein